MLVGVDFWFYCLYGKTIERDKNRNKGRIVISQLYRLKQMAKQKH